MPSLSRHIRAKRTGAYRHFPGPPRTNETTSLPILSRQCAILSERMSLYAATITWRGPDRMSLASGVGWCPGCCRKHNLPMSWLTPPTPIAHARNGSERRSHILMSRLQELALTTRESERSNHRSLYAPKTVELCALAMYAPTLRRTGSAYVRRMRVRICTIRPANLPYSLREL